MCRMHFFTAASVLLLFIELLLGVLLNFLNIAGSIDGHDGLCGGLADNVGWTVTSLRSIELNLQAGKWSLVVQISVYLVLGSVVERCGLLSVKVLWGCDVFHNGNRGLQA